MNSRAELARDLALTQIGRLPATHRRCCSSAQGQTRGSEKPNSKAREINSLLNRPPSCRLGEPSLSHRKQRDPFKGAALARSARCRGSRTRCSLLHYQTGEALRDDRVSVVHDAIDKLLDRRDIMKPQLNQNGPANLKAKFEVK